MDGKVKLIKIRNNIQLPIHQDLDHLDKNTTLQKTLYENCEGAVLIRYQPYWPHGNRNGELPAQPNAKIFHV